MPYYAVSTVHVQYCAALVRCSRTRQGKVPYTAAADPHPRAVHHGEDDVCVCVCVSLVELRGGGEGCSPLAALFVADNFGRQSCQFYVNRLSARPGQGCDVITPPAKAVTSSSHRAGPGQNATMERAFQMASLPGSLYPYLK
ncbi:hypothetical protein E2C01_011343 [Portunus trituberculatus]|uniref:Uncharacterized protein n=1 Tax=Portunus trituberculatus TaxID=210409 RepID=A0A5B7DB15_PORTR|nr:hypothetical protein [Portunus trituberculatus]